MNKFKWNPDKENVCPKNKKGHMFSIKYNGYRYCEYCEVCQCINHSPSYLPISKSKFKYRKEIGNEK